MDISKETVQPVEDGSIIPSGVVGLPQDIEAPEAIPYAISFRKYNKKMCEISELTKHRAKEALKILKIIGTKISCKADFKKYSVGREPIANKGDYARLYNGIDVFSQIYQARIQGDARIFYFDIEPDSTLFVVAITQNHLETDKVRR